MMGEKTADADCGRVLTSRQTGYLSAANSAPQGTEEVVLPQAHEIVAVRGQGKHGPEWHGAGHRWLPHLSCLPHTCDTTMHMHRQ